MKIKRFNENTNFIEDFQNTIDIDIFDWISNISQNTKLKEYKIINGIVDNINYISDDKIKEVIKFSQEKNLPYLKKYSDNEIDIFQLQKQIEKLEKKEKKLYKLASDELLYNFQSELLEKDINNFYVFFLKDNIETSNDYPEDNINIFDEVHPKLLKNKKYKELINIYLNSMKYNI